VGACRIAKPFTSWQISEEKEEAMILQCPSVQRIGLNDLKTSH
jgi:hypothetical protein